MAEVRRWRWGIGALVGAALAAAIGLGWVGVGTSPDVMEVDMSAPEVRSWTAPRTSDGAGDEDPGAARLPLPALEELPMRARSRAEWARDRADWTGGGWVLCDLRPLDPSQASVVFDERGYDGPIDPATSLMVADDGWLALAVDEAAGEAVLDVSDLFESGRLVRVRWEGAEGASPGRCLGPPEPLVLDAELVVTVIEPDGTPLADPDGVETEIYGCGITSFTERPQPVEAGECRLGIARRRAFLPSQVSRGAVTTVEVRAGEVARVTLIAPPPPGAWDLPDLGDTLLLLDVVAFSGNDTLADSLGLVVDDLASADFDPEVVELWGHRAGELAESRPRTAFDAIGRTWQMWDEVQRLRAVEAGEPDDR